MQKPQFPQFHTIEFATYAESLKDLTTRNLQNIQNLLSSQAQYTWENLINPLEEMENQLQQYWSPLSHLHAVMNSKALRECYAECLPILSAYETAIGHNSQLYEAIKSLQNQPLNSTQQKIITDEIRDFELAGVALSAQDKKRFETIEEQLSSLTNQFENNVLDATQAFTIHITDESRLRGIPLHALSTAKKCAEEKKLPGHVFSLEIPSYLAVITHAEDRALRETIYHAYVTRASDQGPSAGQFDNTKVIEEILALRLEKAKLLGFSNYAELSIATKMAESTDQVIRFLEDLSHKAYQQAKNEFTDLCAFAKQNLRIETLAPWDIAFCSEKKRQAEYAISEEALRAYFPLHKVLSGLLFTVKALYGITFQEVKDIDVWHKEVQCFQIMDENQQCRGYLYMDLFARPNKRGGAWMDAFQSRYQHQEGALQLPIASLTCNFAKPAANKPATLSHDELLTLFHEFGHCLHHVLTKVNYLSASGINGVEWDAVELPSQFFENWCYTEEALMQLAEHVDTHETFPHALFEKLVASKNFQSAMAMVRQLEFSLFDFFIHLEKTPIKADRIGEILAKVREKTTVIPIMPYNRMQHSFSHIFAGGYAAGYYSYKWAEVLSSDAFSRFEEEGVFNPKTGKAFLENILEVGSSIPAALAFEHFRGRKATVDALLRQNGITYDEKSPS